MIPRATYRMQFHREFGFETAAELAPYLARLGISHLYASPVLKARPGSTHGYDIVDHAAVNPELGGEAGYARLGAALKASGLGQILDIVPNHMGVGGADNPLWLDVLEWGRNSLYAGWFDIEWEPDRGYLREKVLVPFLGEPFGVALERGVLRLRFEAESGRLAVWAYDNHMLPICPLQYGRILGDAHPELERLGDAFTGLTTRRPHIERRAADLQAELAAQVSAAPDVAAALAASLARYAGEVNDLASWAPLQALIESQHWRIAHFRVAADDGNYRRFFNINELAGVCVEVPEVFDHVHRRILEWLRDGTLDGLRIDHIDGLFDPKAYLMRLLDACRAARAGTARGASEDRPYLVVEKILAPHEHLREDWPVDGTTGYDFANLAVGVLIDADAEGRFDELYARFTSDRRPFGELVRDCKRLVMDSEMASELNVLARDVARLARQNPRTADLTGNLLRRALRELIVCFPVYRTYLSASDDASDADRRDLEWALAQARASRIERDQRAFDFLEALLSGDLVRPRSGFSRQAVMRCVARLQQYSGPVMAKGLEDTALYRYQRFLALNEVGGSPDRFGISLTAFHKANVQRAGNFPHAMLATSTHDTKRGEDARARLAALAELPEEWDRLTTTCSRILRGPPGGTEELAPDGNDEYGFLQMLLASWPPGWLEADRIDPPALEDYAGRLRRAMQKSVREARVHTNWAFPNTVYEEAVLGFVDAALLSTRSAPFLSAFLPFAARIARLGAHNTLVQTVLKLTAPGVPDIYQGSELWDLSLVDPDNRRPVDYRRRARCLTQVERALQNDRAGAMRRFFAEWPDACFKLATLQTLLAFRRDHPALLAAGDYQPLYAQGPQAECIIAFAREHQGEKLLSVSARFPARLEAAGFAAETALELPEALRGHQWDDLLTGHTLVGTATLSARALFRELPAAVLIRR